MCRCQGFHATTVSILVAIIALPASILANAPPANDFFQQTWQRTERPVLENATSRTWMWGPTGRTNALTEPYREAPDGYRTVQYFDKTRMEINNPHADPESEWFVTNGHLAKELITGRIQVGHIDYVEQAPASIQIAGDPHPSSPTYADLETLLDAPARQLGAQIIDVVLTNNGETAVEPNHDFASYDVVAAYYVDETSHTIAEPFWEFMTSEGLIYLDGSNVHGSLFSNPFFATGFPITEAYWVTVPLEGDPTDVLIQCFERRCLTYTPSNPSGWEVEAGNIGAHYHQFRYGIAPFVLDCIDLNVAPIEELLQLRNIGDSRAIAIVENRPYTEVSDLEVISGIGEVTVQEIIEQGLACIQYDEIVVPN